MPLIVFIPLFQVAGLVLFVVPCIVYAVYLASLGDFVNYYSTLPNGTQVLMGLSYQLQPHVASKLWFVFFCFLWTLNFLEALGSMVIALATSFWYDKTRFCISTTLTVKLLLLLFVDEMICRYFTVPEKRVEEISNATLFDAYATVLRYHVGTAAFGSLIIAIIEVIDSPIMAPVSPYIYISISIYLYLYIFIYVYIWWKNTGVDRINVSNTIHFVTM